MATKLASLDRWSLNIPFRTSFRHASASRNSTSALLVEARSADGLTGVGEGCPREYVTGETVAGSLAFVDRHHDSLMAEVGDLESLRDWMRRHATEIAKNQAAWCAIELALLDLFAKSKGQSVEAFLGLPELAGEFRYTAVLGIADTEAFTRQSERYLQAGFTDFKVKVSGDPEKDRAHLAILQDRSPMPLRIRLDANNLWSDPKAAIAYLRGLDIPLFAIEEPLAANDFSGLATIADALNVPIILDESFTSIDQFGQLAGPAERWILNLRISKLGGLLRSLSVAEAARTRGLKMIIGAQVGETSILTRAALTVASAARDLVAGQEGAFGTLLLQTDITQPALMFGQDGLLSAGVVAGRPGLGLDLSRHIVARFLPAQPAG